MPRMGEAAYPIVIVGGGPAGLSTWLHLEALAPELAAQAVLIEKATYPRDKLCGGGITPLGDRLLGGLGVELDCPSVPIHVIECRYADRTIRVQQPNAMRVVRRCEFDHALMGAAVDRGLELREGERFTGFTRVADGLRVATTRGTYHARVLVGADGVYSAVRRCAVPTEESRVARLVETIDLVAWTEPPFATNTAIFDFRPVAAGLQGYVWHFPCLVDGCPAVNRGIYDSRVVGAQVRVNLERLFADALRSEGRVVAPPAWGGHSLRWLGDDTVMSAANVLLVGDAAGVDAALGEGIAPSLDYGDFAANFLVDAFARNDLGFADTGARLRVHPLGGALYRRYHLARRAYSGDRAALADVPQLIAGVMAS